jgi:lipid A 4'-phosphatase
MNRTGLAIALTVAVVVGVVFAIYPRFDLDLSELFFDRAKQGFVINVELWVRLSRSAARVIIGLLVAPAILALVGKLILPGRRVLIDGRAALLLVVTLTLGPGLIANTLLKDHWGRARPIDVTEFGGDQHFTPWWDPRGDCPNNCSFIAGEPSGAFWTFAPAALAPPQWRALAYCGVFVFGVAVGLLRMAAGAHFFTDVVFAGVMTFLLVWILHGVFYRWRGKRAADGTTERPLE